MMLRIFDLPTTRTGRCALALVHLQQAALKAGGDGFGAVNHLELGKDRLHVEFGGVFRCSRIGILPIIIPRLALYREASVRY